MFYSIRNKAQYFSDPELIKLKSGFIIFNSIIVLYMFLAIIGKGKFNTQDDLFQIHSKIHI